MKIQRITSRRNETAGHIKKLGADREYRYRRGEFLCDGIRLLREAVASNCVVTAVFAAHTKDIDSFQHEFNDEFAGVPVYEVTEDVMKFISPLKTAQDVLFSCRMPLSRAADPTGQNIVLDGVQDPGNVGTVIRAANAFGIDSVILTGACADPFNPKTVRATMRAVFRQNVIQVEYSQLSSLVSQGLLLYGAALGESARDIRDVNLANISVAIGSEGSGLSQKVMSICKERVSIPIKADMESLNAAVAASIIMWEMYNVNA